MPMTVGEVVDFLSTLPRDHPVVVPSGEGTVDRATCVQVGFMFRFKNGEDIYMSDFDFAENETDIPPDKREEAISVVFINY